MSLGAWIGIGLLGGLILGWLGGQRGRPLVAEMVVAVLGAVGGGFMAAVMLGLDITGLDGLSCLIAALGVVVLILFERAIPRDEVFD